MQGGWTGVLTSLAGAFVFTLGSMSHHNTHEGTESSRSLTLTSAAIAAALARAYYFKAIAGVAGMSWQQGLHSLSLAVHLPDQTNVKLAGGCAFVVQDEWHTVNCINTCRPSTSQQV